MKKFSIMLALLLAAAPAFAESASFSINLGTDTAEKSSVLLYFSAPADTAFMEISNTSSFSGSLKPYAPALVWDICSGRPECPPGRYEVFAKLVSRAGEEQIISSSISYLASMPALPAFNRILKLGAEGEDVRALQIYLNSKGFTVASSGPGSPGQETAYFGPRTRSALIKFQETHAKDILAPLGLSAGTGIFGFRTIDFITKNF